MIRTIAVVHCHHIEIRIGVNIRKRKISWVGSHVILDALGEPADTVVVENRHGMIQFIGGYDVFVPVVIHIAHGNGTGPRTHHVIILFETGTVVQKYGYEGISGGNYIQSHIPVDIRKIQ